MSMERIVTGEMTGRTKNGRVNLFHHALGISTNQCKIVRFVTEIMTDDPPKKWKMGLSNQRHLMRIVDSSICWNVRMACDQDISERMT
jgi:hypothetical protein